MSYIPVTERVVNWDRENAVKEPEETSAPSVPTAAKATRRRKKVEVIEVRTVVQAPQPVEVSDDDTMPTFIAYSRKGYYRE